MKMKKLFIIILLLGVLSGCITAQVSLQSEELSFSLASDHFLKNNITLEANPICLVINQYSSFNNIFGAVCTMSDTKEKNDIGFVSEEAMEGKIALCLVDATDHTIKGRDITIDMEIEKITMENKILKVCYRSEITGTGKTFSANFLSIALIDDIDFNSIEFFKNGKPDKSVTIKIIK